MVKYKLYPISRFILLSSKDSDYAELFEMAEDFYWQNKRNMVMKIKKDQCTRLIWKFGKTYYRIEVKQCGR